MAGVLIASALSAAQAQAPSPWSFFGSDLANTRANLTPASGLSNPSQINTRTAPKLALKWAYSTVGDVAATPTVDATGVYFPDYAGYLYKLDPATGALRWSHSVADYAGSTYGYSRTSPAIGALGEIVLGIGSGYSGASPGARVVSVDKTDGHRIWQAIVDTTNNSYVTSSPVIYNRIVYVGVASSEEVLAGTAGYTPHFRGSVVALNEATGALIWRFYTVPDGYTGGSVWSGNPVVFPQDKALLIGTGNNITIPAASAQCVLDAGADNDRQVACLNVADFVDSIVSLDLATGKIKWSRRTVVDTWNKACKTGPQAPCPNPAGADLDFASAPNLVYLDNFTTTPDDRGGTSKYYFMGAGQKSAVYWGLNPYNGGLFWSRSIGAGEIVWGSAINMGVRDSVYVALASSATNTLAGQNGVPVVSTGGAWASINLRKGTINWQVPTIGTTTPGGTTRGSAIGPISYTNRVMFAGSTSGIMAALDSNTGRSLWSFNAGGSIIGGAAIYNETVYFGAGSTRSGPGAVHTLFAFAVPPAS